MRKKGRVELPDENIKFQARKNQPAAGWWFPEESLARLEQVLVDGFESERIERAEDRKVGGVEE